MDLATYQMNVLSLLNDPGLQFYTSTNIQNWINLARVEVSKFSYCIRVLAPSSAPLTAVTVTAGGSGYTAATVTISGPDALNGSYTTATATATVVAGVVTAVNLTNAGTGYVLTPTVTIDGDGTGATATATVNAHLTTTMNQEVYTHAAVTPVIQTYYPGVQAIIGVLDIAVSWGAVKPNLDYYPWAAFQAYARAINQGQSWPAIWSQYALGEPGSVYLFPIPSGQYEMQWDCFCTPKALSAIQTTDLIPDNWTVPVFYYACHLAYLSAQRRDDANDMFQRYQRALVESNAYATPLRTPSFYSGDL